MKKKHDKEFFERQKRVLANLEVVFLIAGICSVIYIVYLGVLGQNETVAPLAIGALVTFFVSLLFVIILQNEWNDAQLELILLRLKK